MPASAAVNHMQAVTAAGAQGQNQGAAGANYCALWESDQDETHNQAQLDIGTQFEPDPPGSLGACSRQTDRQTVKTSSFILGLWLRLECSLDSLSIDSAHVIYVSEGYDVAYNRRTASQPSYVVLRVTWYVKTFRNVNYVC